MNKPAGQKLTALALLCALAASAQADNFRCGKWIANADMTPSELLSKCGEPSKRETRTEDVYSRGLNGTYKSGEVTVETWVYQRGNSASPMIVTIVDGEIKSVERQP